MSPQYESILLSCRFELDQIVSLYLCITCLRRLHVIACYQHNQRQKEKNSDRDFNSILVAYTQFVCAVLTVLTS